MKNFFHLLLLLTVLISAGCSTVSSSSSLPLQYKNTDYGFAISLPANWQGFSVLQGTWEGTRGVEVVERGPGITIRNPHWTAKAPTQDIPIEIFTIKQWDMMQLPQGGFATAAGGYESEFLRNSQYVFCVHSRFNTADEVKGWREATDIVGHLFDQHFAMTGGL